MDPPAWDDIVELFVWNKKKEDARPLPAHTRFKFSETSDLAVSVSHESRTHTTHEHADADGETVFASLPKVARLAAIDNAPFSPKVKSGPCWGRTYLVG